MSEHPNALTLSLLIHAEKLHRLEVDGFETGLQYVIGAYLGARGYSEEKMSDLYAMLAEKLQPNMMHSEMRVICSECLHKADEWRRA